MRELLIGCVLALHRLIGLIDLCVVPIGSVFRRCRSAVLGLRRRFMLKRARLFDMRDVRRRAVRDVGIERMHELRSGIVSGKQRRCKLLELCTRSLCCSIDVECLHGVRRGLVPVCIGCERVCGVSCGIGVGSYIGDVVRGVLDLFWRHVLVFGVERLRELRSWVIRCEQRRRWVRAMPIGHVLWDRGGLVFTVCGGLFPTVRRVVELSELPHGNVSGFDELNELRELCSGKLPDADRSDGVY